MVFANKILIYTSLFMMIFITVQSITCYQDQVSMDQRFNSSVRRCLPIGAVQATGCLKVINYEAKTITGMCDYTNCTESCTIEENISSQICCCTTDGCNQASNHTATQMTMAVVRILSNLKNAFYGNKNNEQNRPSTGRWFDVVAGSQVITMVPFSPVYPTLQSPTTPSRPLTVNTTLSQILPTTSSVPNNPINQISSTTTSKPLVVNYTSHLYYKQCYGEYSDFQIGYDYYFSGKIECAYGTPNKYGRVVLFEKDPFYNDEFSASSLYGQDYSFQLRSYRDHRDPPTMELELFILFENVCGWGTGSAICGSIRSGSHNIYRIEGRNVYWREY